MMGGAPVSQEAAGAWLRRREAAQEGAEEVTSPREGPPASVRRGPARSSGLAGSARLASSCERPVRVSGRRAEGGASSDDSEYER